MERKGAIISKVLIGTRIELPGRIESIETDDDAMAKLLQVEMYLNEEVATEIYRKFGVILRVHL